MSNESAPWCWKKSGIFGKSKCALAYLNETAIGLCPPVWDGFLCWPPTTPGSTVQLRCPRKPGNDVTKFAFRICQANGTWGQNPSKTTFSQAGWTNYQPCFNNYTLHLMRRLLGSSNSTDELISKTSIAAHTRILEMVGLIISALSLILALIIFGRFRNLWNNRTRIHKNLFIAMTIQVLIRLVLYIDQYVDQKLDFECYTLVRLDTLSNLSFDNVLDNQQDLPFDNHVAGEEATGGASTSIEGPHNAHNNHHPPVPGESSTGGPGVSSFSVTNPPIPAPRTSKQIKPNSIPLTSAGGASASDINGKAGSGVSGVFGDHEIESATIKVCVTDADFDMDESIHLPPGAEYVPSILDLPKSPSQLKILKGAGFLPTEEPGAISEDESSISSCAALLDLNIHNGDVRLKKRTSDGIRNSELKKPNFIVPSIVFDTSGGSNSEHVISDFNETSLSTVNGDGEESLLQIEASDVLDDYLEDFYLPHSHESVMSRQLSFRRKVQKQLETAAAERAVQELDRFEAMLDTYEEEDEYEQGMNGGGSAAGGNNIQVDNKNRHNSATSGNNSSNMSDNMDSLSSTISSASTPTGDNGHVAPVPKTRAKSLLPNFHNKNNTVTNGQFLINGTTNSNHLRTSTFGKGFSNGMMDSDFDFPSGAPSLSLDIDAIVKENAPNLMDSRKNSSDGMIDTIPEHGPEESMSSYFLPQPTLDKLYAVYESSNFNNIYCLSGELKDILTPVEIEEIVANKDHLEKFIDPNVMAALSWSINEASLPYIPPPSMENTNGSKANNNSSSKDVSSEVEQNKLNAEKLGDVDGTDLGLIENGLKSGSKSSSMSNGFHSDASTSEDDLHSNDDAASSTSSSRLEVPNDEDNDHLNSSSDCNSANNKRMVPVKDKYSESERNGGRLSVDNLELNQSTFQRGTSLSNSLRRKISLGRDTPKSPSRICYSPDGGSSVKRGNSQESLETDLGVCEDDWEDEEEDTHSKKSSSSGVVLVRRDSKRFSFKGKDGHVERVVEGLFVESKNPNPNGTLRRIRAPLNLTEDLDDGLESPEGSSLVEVKEQNEAKSPKVHKKRISVDDKILSVISSSDMDDNSAATDVTQSDVFHSIINTLRDDDATMKSDEDEGDDITLDIDTPDDMEDSILEQLDSLSAQPNDIIREYSVEEELEDARRWKSFKVGPNDIQIDLKAIHPYRRVLSHGGYFDAEKNVAIILFSGCYLPDRSRKEYTYLMDHLFLYVLSTLEELVVDDYILVYLHGATPKTCMPTFGWLKRCYQLIDRRLKKNLKALYMVHPTFWLRTIVALTKPFVSTKFSRKVQFVNTLSDLCLEIPTEHLVIPDRVLQYDFDLKVDDLKRRKIMS